jgi:hypothetical protein
MLVGEPGAFMSRLAPSMLSLVAMVACGGTDSDDTAAEPAVGTDTAADGGASDTFSFALDGEVENAALGLFALDVAAGMTPGVLLSAGAVSGDVAVVPSRVPGADALVPFPEDTALSFGLYAPLAWRDVDADLARDEDEPFLGSGLVVLAYFSDVNAALAAEGYGPGWNAIAMSLDGARPTVLPRDALRLPLNLVPQESLTLQGTSDGSLGETAHVAVIATDGDSPPERLLADTPATATWSLTVAGAPEPLPTGPFLQLQGTPGVYGLVAVWSDTDGSGAYGLGDATVPVCADGQAGPSALTALWIGAVTNGNDAVMMGFTGLRAGWHLMTAADGGLAEVDASTPLLASTRCGAPPS